MTQTQKGDARPVHLDDSTMIFQGRAEELIPRLGPFVRDASQIVFLTSPPYNQRNDFRPGGGPNAGVQYGGYGEHDDDLPWPVYREWQTTILNQLHDLGADWGFYNHKQMIRGGEAIFPHVQVGASRWVCHQCLILHANGTPLTDPIRFFPNHELMFVLKRSTDQKLDNRSRLYDVWRYNTTSSKAKVVKRSDHPAPMDATIVSRCLSAVPDEPGTIVVDPFAGSGTTLVEARRVGWRAIGIELNPRFVEFAANRLRQRSLFE